MANSHPVNIIDYSIPKQEDHNYSNNAKANFEHNMFNGTFSVFLREVRCATMTGMRLYF